MGGPTTEVLSKRQEEVEKNVATVKAEIEAAFNRMRDALNAREEALLKEVERMSEELNLVGTASKASEMEEEARNVIAAGQEALGWKSGRE